MEELYRWTPAGWLVYSPSSNWRSRHR
jgi:hypothetical protein